MATVREHDYQVGVFAYTGSGEVVLVTNRKGHSWILPKGNREKKREGSLHYKHYDFQFYDKSKKLRIYSMKVKAMLNDFPEVRERKRMVTTFDRAEKMVKEEYLKIIQELRKRIF